MTKTYSIKEIANNILGEPMTWKYVLGEIKELITDRNYSEFSDVIATSSLALYNYFPKIGNRKPKHAQDAFNRWVKRKAVWELIFKAHKLDFDKKCVKKGGNYTRDTKVKIAFEIAGYSGKIDWDAINKIRAENPE